MITAKTVVLKFGSSVLAEVDAIPRAVHEVYRQVQAGNRVVVVVSALAGETDKLLGMVETLDTEANPHRVADFVATGEKQSARLMAIALERVGITVRVVDPFEVDFVAAGPCHDANPVGINHGALREMLLENQAVVLPGYFATDNDYRTVLLGRGGSHATAMFVASELEATCRLVKDVDGIFERDPALPGPAPRRFDTISWEDALEVAEKLVQPKAIEFAATHNMEFEVCSLGTTGGTTVGAGPTRLSDKPHTIPGPLRVVLLGAGTVGYGVYRLLALSPQQFEIVGIAVRDPEKHRFALPPQLLTTDAKALLRKESDIVVELMGGDREATDSIRFGLTNNCDVVTANKSVIAKHGGDLEELAHRNGRILRCSASVGGGLPAIESIRRVAALARVSAIEGVLNGTCNFVLDHLASGWLFDDAVREAQRLGFAEADPTQDLSGEDAASKIRILARTAFGVELSASDVAVTGIEGITRNVARDARAMGQEVRLVARCWKSSDKCTATVGPQFLDAKDHLASVRGANNMLRLILDGNETIVITGKGAGRWPTSESVFADILYIYRYRLASPSLRELKIEKQLGG